MMRQMRQNTKWIMVLTAASFVGLMVFQWGMDASGRSSVNSGEIGSVNGTPVRLADWQAVYRQLYDEFRLSQPGPITSVQIKQIEDLAFDQMVNRLLIEGELRRREIRVTDAEIVQAVRFNPPPGVLLDPAFQTDGVFDMDRYQDYLASPALDEQLLVGLESYYRDVIPGQKLLRQVQSGIFLSDRELWLAYRDANETVDAQFVAIPAATAVPDSTVAVTDQEVRAYYEQNQENFSVPAQASVRVVTISSLPTAQDSAAARLRVVALRERLVDGEDFGEMAMAESGDPGTAAIGGDLGVFVPGRMDPVFTEIVFASDAGTLTEPLQTYAGLHIIEVQERWGQDSAQARHILVPIVRTEDSEIRLLTLADSLEDLTEDLTLTAAAAELGLTVQDIDLSEAFPFIPAVGIAEEGADWVFEEAAVGEVSPVFETPLAFYAFELVDARPEGIQSLVDARPSVERIVRLEKKLEAARDIAEQISAAARTSSLEEAATATGQVVAIEGPFSRIDFVTGMGRQNIAIGTAFGLTVGQISSAVVSQQTAYVIELTGRTPADSTAWMDQLAMQRADLTRIVESERQNEWLLALREAADIVDDRDAFFAAQNDAQVARLPAF